MHQISVALKICFMHTGWKIYISKEQTVQMTNE